MELLIDNLKVFDLVDTGSYFDAQDPALSITIGKTTHITERKVDAKAQATFDEKFSFPVSQAEYDDNNFMINVEVFNVGMTGSKVHVGKGSVSMKQVISKSNEPFPITIDLTHESKKKTIKQGKAQLTCFLKAKEQPKQPSASQPTESQKTSQQPTPQQPISAKDASSAKLEPTATKQPEAANPVAVSNSNPKTTLGKLSPGNYKLTVTQLKAADLYDTGNMLDAQDPCLILSLGKQTFQTAREADGATKAKFRETFEFILSADEIESGIKLNAEVVSVNMMGSKTHVGVGSIPINTAIGELDKPSPMHIPLIYRGKGKDGIEKGFVNMEGRLSKIEDKTAASAAVETAKPSSQTSTNKAPEELLTKQSSVANTKGNNSAKNDKEGESEDELLVIPNKKDANKASKPVPTAKSLTLSPGNYKLILSKLKASDLYDTGSMLDKQDPCLILTIGKQIFQTARQKDKGTEADFPETFEIMLSADELNQKVMLNADVVNVNMMGSKTHIGSGSIPIITAIDELDKPSSMNIPLMYRGKGKDGVEKGYVNMEGRLSKVEAKVVVSEKVQSEAPANNMKDSSKSTNPSVTQKNEGKTVSSLVVPAGNYSFTVSALKASELFDTGHAMDKQDPCLSLTVGKQKHQTARQKDKGTEADFPETFEFILTSDEINSNIPIEAEVVSVNLMGSKTHVGIGSVPINVLLSQANVLTPLRIPLQYRKSQTDSREKGYVSMNGMLKLVENNSKTVDSKGAKEGSALSEKTSVIPLPVGNYEILLSECAVKELHNGGNMFDKQDPCLEITIGQQKLQTARQKDSGTEAKFPETLEFHLSKEDSATKEIMVKVEAMNMNKFGTCTHLGVISFNLRDFVTSLSSPFPLHFDLQHIPTSSLSAKGPQAGTPKGQLDCLCQVLPIQHLEKDIELEMVFLSAKVQSMKNVELMPLDKNDLYLVTQIGTMWSFRTDTLHNSGESGSWDCTQDMKYLQSEENICLTTPKQLTTTGIVVQCWDENSIREHTLIGEGHFHVPKTWFDDILNTNNKEADGKAAAINNNPTHEVKVTFFDEKKHACGSGTILFGVYERGKRPKPSATNPLIANINAQNPSKSTKLDANKQKKIESFQSGTLKISKIICQNLVNVESLGGKNDPFATITLLSQTFHTDTIEEGGSDVVFPYLDMTFPITRDILAFEALKIQITDKNNAFANKLIGANELSSLLFLLERIEEECEVPIEIKDAKGKVSGKVILYMKLLPSDPAQHTKLLAGIESFGAGTLDIVRVRVMDVPKITNQQLFFRVAHDEWQFESSVIDLSRVSIPLFDNLLDCNLRVTSKSLASTVLRGELVMKGMLGDSIVGKGSCSLQTSVLKLGEEQEIPMELSNTKGNTVIGRLMLYVVLRTDAMITSMKASQLTNDFQQGYFRISSITANGLKNTEWLGKQDPYIVLQYGDWKDKTKTQDNQGNDCTWDNIDLFGPITRQDILSNPPKTLKLIAYDDNTGRSDQLIGQGEIDLFSAVNNLEKNTTLTAKLMDTEGKKLAGRVQIQCMITTQDLSKAKDAAAASVGEIPAKFPKATFLTIQKIQTKNLKSGNVFAAPKTRIELVYTANWKESTGMKEDNNPTLVWDLLDWQSSADEALQLTSEILQKEPLVVNYYDNQKLIGTGTIPNLMITATRLGLLSDVTVEIIHQKSKKSTGQVTISMMLQDSTQRKAKVTEVINAAVIEAVLPKLDYTEGELNISFIQLTDIQNRELFGQADPFVRLQLGNWVNQTSVLTNAGTNIIWDNLSVTNQSTVDEFLSKPLEISVMDKNNFRQNAFLGKVSLSLKRLVYSVNQEIELVEELLDSKGNKSAKGGGLGKVILRAQIRKIDSTKQSMIPKDIREIQLNIHRIHLFELVNKEMIGKQDPFIVMKLGNVWKEQTPVKEDGGSDVIFDELEISTPTILTSSLIKDKLEIEVYDQDTVGQKFLGKGLMPLRQINALDKEFQFPIILQSANADMTGRALIFVSITKPDPTAAAGADDNLDSKKTITLPDGFTYGTFSIRRVGVYHLKKVNMLTKQDPYVIFQLGGNGGGDGKKTTTTSTEGDWIGKTTVMDNAGSDCIWDLLDLSTPISSDMIQQNIPFTITVMSKSALNLTGDSKHDDIIGTKTISIQRAGLNLGKETKFECNILDKKSSKPAGKIVFYVDIQPEEKEINYKIPESFVCGQLKITRIDAFHLKNTEFLGMGKQDPFITLSIGDIWTEKTYTLENISNSSARWDHLPLQCDLTKEQIQQYTLQIIVSDENTTRSNVMIGQVTNISLAKCCHFLGKEIELKVTLVDSAGKNAGKLIIFCQMNLLTPDQELPSEFASGIFRLKRITLFGMKASADLLGLDKLDPYLVVTLPGLPEFQKQTNVIANGGGNITWNHLDMEGIVDKKIMKIGELVCDVYDENSITANQKMGTAKFSMKKFANSLGKDYEYTMDVIGVAKGQTIGKLTVYGQVEPQAVQRRVELGFPKDFSVGTLLITKLQAKNLKNTEWLGKQDPYAKISIGDWWSETTSTLNNAGSNPYWEDLSLQCEITRELLEQADIGGKCTIQFFDENFSRGDAPLGTGKVSLKSCCARINEEVSLPLDLSDAKGTIVGKAMIAAKIIPGKLEDMNEKLPESVVKIEKGFWKVYEIMGYDLNGLPTSMINAMASQAFVQLTIGTDWSNQTTPMATNKTKSLSWQNIPDLETSLTKDQIIYQPLKVSIMVKGNGVTSGDSVISTGELSLRKLATQLEKMNVHIIRLKDARGRAAGRLECRMMLSPLVEEETEKKTSKGPMETKMGKLQFAKCIISDVKNVSALSGKQELYVKVSLPPTNWTNTFPNQKNVTTSAIWNHAIESNPIANTQLLQSIQGIKAEVYAKGMMSDSLLGEVLLKPTTVVDTVNEWYEYKEKLTLPGSGGKYSGKLQLTVRFATEATLLSNWMSEAVVAGTAAAAASVGQAQSNSNNGNNSIDMTAFHSSQENILKKVNKLEQGLKTLLHDELNQEHQQMKELLLAQQKEFSTTIDKLSKSFAKQLKDAKDSSQATLPVQPDQELPPITKVELPKNVSRWRTPHVQAWLAFQLELAQYVPAFADASIDGLVLLNHVTSNLLEDHVGITNPIHLTKILSGVDQLQAQQKRYESLIAEERRKKAEREALEKARRDQLLADKLAEENAKNKPQKKAKKSGGTVTMGDMSTKAGIERIKLEKHMKEFQNTTKKKAIDKDRKGKIWAFEYTGEMSKQAIVDETNNHWDTILDKQQTTSKLGTNTYQKMMNKDLVSDILPPSQRALRTVPANCTPEEILAVIKGAMFDVSTWLLYIEQKNIEKQVRLDDDLLDDNNNMMYDEDDDNNNKNNNNDEYDENDDENVSSNNEEEDDEYMDNIGRGDEASLPSYGEVLESDDKVHELKSASSLPGYDEIGSNEDDKEHDEDNEEEGDLPGYSEILDEEEEVKLSVMESIPIPPLQGKPSSSMSRYGNNNTNKSHRTVHSLRPSTISSSSQKRTFADMDYPPVLPDRMTLIYHAMIHQQNNSARWLGKNEKLTRLKLAGGLETLLKLSLSWEQFDTLWTKLDYKRSGDIDLNEFKAFFGDLSEFETKEGTQLLSLTGLKQQSNGLSSSNNNYTQELALLTKSLFQLCDLLRNAGFSIPEMFASFDRNGSQSISISEFCSLLRKLVPTSSSTTTNNNSNNSNAAVPDRRLIYRALTLLDTDGNKSISLHEFMMFVYRIWKTQLDELAQELYRLQDDNDQQQHQQIASEQQKLMNKLITERSDIKQAIKRNFPRAWRDQLERTSSGHHLPGPFTAILQRMGMDAGTKTLRQSQSMEDMLLSSPQPTRNTAATTNSFKHRPPPSSGTRSISGHNQVMAMKLRLPAGQIPQRTVGNFTTTLRVPKTKNLDNQALFSGEMTQSVLNSMNHLGKMI